MLRFVASVLITSGVLMLCDAGLTLAWQEPVSAFIAAREQSRLGHRLDVDAGGIVAREKLLVASIRSRFAASSTNFTADRFRGDRDPHQPAGAEPGLRCRPQPTRGWT